MKCKNCTCQISSDFKHAFNKNCCPKCGQELMTVEVKALYLKMGEVLEQNNNDMGDLAVWFIDTYFTKESQVSEQLEVVDESQSNLEPESIKEKPAVILKPTKKPVSPTGNQDKKLLSEERTNIFAKRAGIEKDKYKNLIKDIQGLTSSDDLGSYSSDHMGSSNAELANVDPTPLSYNEMSSLSEVFEPANQQLDLGELKRIQRLEEMSSRGSVGKIKRIS